MPISLSKADTFRLSLISDMSVPEEKRPYFEFAPLTGRQQKVMATALENLTDGKTTALSIIEDSFGLITPHIVGWGNLFNKEGLEIAFHKDEMEDILQFQEAQELAWKVFGYAPQLEELKNSASQSPISTEKSASPEPVKDAKTP